MITVGISEADSVIYRLVGQHFASCGLHCGVSPKEANVDVLLRKAHAGHQYDVLVENDVPAVGVRAKRIHLVNTDAVVPCHSPEQTILITYGLNPFSTATASSIVQEDGYLHFQYCLQRNLLSLSEHLIECQEFPVSVYQPFADLHSSIATVTLALLLGISPNQLLQIGATKK